MTPHLKLVLRAHRDRSPSERNASTAHQMAPFRNHFSALLRSARERKVRRLARRHWKEEAFGEFGPGSWIQPPALVTSPGRIYVGQDVTIMARSWLSVVDFHGGRTYEPKLVIGDRTSLGHDFVVACMGSVEIGPDVLASDRVFIGDTYHDFRDPSKPIAQQPMSDPRPVRVERGAFLGVGAIVLPGVTIGENAYVAAGSVVTRDVKPRTVVAGNPATLIRRWSEYEERWASAKEVPPGQGGASPGDAERPKHA